MTSYSLWTWGGNTSGELGLGDVVFRSSPVQLGASTNWSAIAVRDNFAFGLTSAGALYSWGNNATYGELGQGNLTLLSTPTQIGLANTWTQVSSPHYGGFATTTTGALYIWGRGSFGEMGLGNTTHCSSPTQLGSLTNWNGVLAGGYYTCAVRKSDGTLWTWGQNNLGALGLGDNVNRSSPVQVGSLTSWSALAASNYSYYATNTAGNLYTWGYNGQGQLGDGTTVNKNSPVQVGVGTTWSQVTGGWYHSHALKTDGTLWGFGRNASGQLGFSNTSSGVSTPTQIGTLTTWATVNDGSYFATATDTVGRLWSWGKNVNGPLGLGSAATNTSADRSSPTQVGALTTWTSLHGGRYNAFALQTVGGAAPAANGNFLMFM